MLSSAGTSLGSGRRSARCRSRWQHGMRIGRRRVLHLTSRGGERGAACIHAHQVGGERAPSPSPISGFVPGKHRTRPRVPEGR